MDIWFCWKMATRITTIPDFGGLGLVNPQAAVLDNGINPDGTIAIGTGAGFGNNSAQFGAPGSSIVGHSSLFRPNNVDIYKPSATFMLITSPGAVNPGDAARFAVECPTDRHTARRRIR